MVKIYIGIEDGVIGSIYSTCRAEVIVVDLDKQNSDPLAISEFKSQKVSHKLINGFKNEAIAEYKSYELVKKKISIAPLKPSIIGVHTAGYETGGPY